MILRDEFGNVREVKSLAALSPAGLLRATPASAGRVCDPVLGIGADDP
jgi:hypothetical protein